MQYHDTISWYVSQYSRVFTVIYITGKMTKTAHGKPKMAHSYIQNGSPLKRSAQVQYNYNNITQKLLYCSSPHKRNTTAIQVFLQLLQVACKFSASCRKLVLQCCIAGVTTSAIQLQCKKKFLYCSCIALVRTA